MMLKVHAEPCPQCGNFAFEDDPVDGLVCLLCARPLHPFISTAPSVHPHGSENRMVTIWLTAPEQPRIIAGCFEGTLEAFEHRVKETHGDNEYAREYGATVEYLRSLVKARGIEVAS